MSEEKTAPVDDAEAPGAQAHDSEAHDAETTPPAPPTYSAAVGALGHLIAAIGQRGDPRACGVEAEQVVASFDEAGVPFKLQVVSPAVFCGGKLVVVSAEDMAAVRQMLAALDVANVGVLEANVAPQRDEWLIFGAAIVAAARGDSSRLGAAVGGSLQFGRHPAARQGGDPKQFDPEVFATARIDSVRKSVEQLAEAQEWNLATARDTIQALERCHNANAAATLRALEVGPNPWSPAASAISIALHLLRTLQLLGVSVGVRRAVAHAGLALGCSGLAAGGRPLDHAGKAAWTAIQAWLAQSDGARATSHDLRMIGVIAAFAPDDIDVESLAGPFPLIRILYEMERVRVRADAGRHPSLTDLLGHAHEGRDEGLDMRWVAALVRSVGGLGVGTTVRLPDGTVGVAVDRGRTGDPLMPLVMHGRGFAQPDARVTPIAST